VSAAYALRKLAVDDLEARDFIEENVSQDYSDRVRVGGCRTRSGDILRPHQRVDVMTALKAMTIWPAWQNFEEDHKGSIEVSKLADFAILSDNPTRIDPEALDQIKVLATIKDGSVIYEAKDHTRTGEQTSSPFMGDPVTVHRFLQAMYQATSVERRAMGCLLTPTACQRLFGVVSSRR
jgi:hypothetical protein